jgi:hypothetical protein
MGLGLRASFERNILDQNALDDIFAWLLKLYEAIKELFLILDLLN